MARAGDGESDVLSAGPAWPLGPPVSQRCPRGGAGSWPGGPWGQVWSSLAELQLHWPVTLSRRWRMCSTVGVASQGQLGQLLVRGSPPPFFCKVYLLLDETLNLPGPPDHTPAAAQEMPSAAELLRVVLFGLQSPVEENILLGGFDGEQ